MDVDDLLKKTRDGATLSGEDLVFLLGLPPDSADAYRVLAEGNRVSREITGNRAEVHAQLALNLAPCPCDCLFCSFAQVNGVFTEETRLSAEEAVAYARRFEADGANAVYVMTTARYPFGLFLEVSREIRRSLKPETILVANVGDQPPERAMQIREAGYAGVYHALRLREGADTLIPPARRKESIRAFREAGLAVGTCVEPLGPEHTNEEIAEAILFTASVKPAYSGAARRIAIPGTEIARRGMINELRMAQIVAVTRLGVPRSVLGNCTHEPCTLGGLGGANLFWAESGANPRDTEEATEKGRGLSVPDCRKLFHECGWGVLDGVSRYMNGTA
ncbi:MAG: radical SAM protein [Syntrophaceae bacterium]|nr:radical SAM protein [Syntrophaceae bacterium]